MKRFLPFLLVVMMFTIVGCNQNNDSNFQQGINTEENNTHMLVAYFSWSGNTEKVAEEISRQTGADLYEIMPKEPYSKDYQETIDRCHEEQDTEARPEIDGRVENIEKYNTIFLGFPVWSSDLPAINRTFLEQYDFSGKTIVPFCTHAGSRFGSSISTIEQLAPEALIEDGYETGEENVNECSEEVKEWLQDLGYVKE